MRMANYCLGTRRARAAAMLTTSLPGGVYVYQGAELGLREIENLPDELREHPGLEAVRPHRPRSRRLRIPIPWGGSDPPFDFGDGSAWLPQHGERSDFPAEVQATD